MNKHIKFNLLWKRLRMHLCLHKYETFKVGEFPLVAAFCTNCGRVKFGNRIYHDGTTYQKVYNGNKAINFVKEFIITLENRNKIIMDMRKQNLLDYTEDHYTKDYETINRYNKIICMLENVC